VLPLAAQTTETGSLAALMSSLGLSVEEVDLDAESDAESDVDSARCDTEDDELMSCRPVCIAMPTESCMMMGSSLDCGTVIRLQFECLKVRIDGLLGGRPHDQR